MPVLVGPLQALLAILPGILVALGGGILALFRPSVIKRLAQLLWSQKVAVAVCAVAAWGIVELYGLAFPHRAEAVSAASGGAGWPLWRGGADRRGFVPGQEDPLEGGVVWSFSRDGIKAFYASPAIAGNRLYVTSGRYEYFRNEGAIYSVDTDTGQLVWAFRAGGYRATFSSPAVSGKYLVVGEGLHMTDDARVFCLDVEQSEKRREGVKLWEYRTRSHVECSPCIDGDRAYIGAGDDGFYCFALEPDGRGEARVLWHLEGSKYPDCETSPVAYQGRVYFGLGIGGQAVCCIDAQTGAELWRIPTPYPAFGSPAIAEGKLFVGMGHGDYVNTAEQVAANLRAKLRQEGKSEAEIEEATRDIRSVGEVWCIDLATHQVEWKIPLGGTVLGAVAAADGRLYFGSRDGYVYCASTRGALMRKWNAHAPIVTSPAVGEGHVYAMTESGQLYGLALSELSPVWGVPLNSPSFSSPVVAHGHVYVGTANYGLLCVGQPSRQEEQAIWAGPLGGPGKWGQADRSLLPLRGQYAWSYPETPEAEGNQAAASRVHAPAAYLNGAFYVGLDREGTHGLARLKPANDLSQAPALEWFAEAQNPVYLSPAVTDDAVFFVDGRPSDSGRALRCLDPATGRERWQHPIAPDAAGDFVIAHDAILIADTAAGLACLGLDASAPPKEIWHADVGPCVGPIALAGDIAVAAVGSPASLVALDAFNGAVLWSRPLPSAPTTGPAFAGGKVWVGQPNGLQGYGLVEGVAPSSLDCGSAPAALVHDATRLACVTDAGELIFVDPQAAREVARIKEGVRALPPLLAGSACLYVTENALQLYDFETQKSTQWAQMRSSWPGVVLTPMIMVQSHVFLATDMKGFVCMRPRSR